MAAAFIVVSLKFAQIGGGEMLTEHVSLRERSKNGDLITKDLARRPRDTRSSRVDTIYDKLTSPPYVIDCVFKNLRRAGSLNDDVEAIWIFILERLELNLWVLTA